jgi:hypothetical protein
MTLSPKQERVIRRAARAERRYWNLVKRLDDDPAARRAVLESRVRINAELRGDRRTNQEPADLSEPLHVAVEREIGRQRPVIRQLVASRRAKRREGVTGCGLVQLALSRSAALRRHLWSVIRGGGLLRWQLAEAIGVSEKTIDNAVNNPRELALPRRSWIARLESATLIDGYYCLVVRTGAPRHRRWPSISAAEKVEAYRRAGLLSDDTPAEHPSPDDPTVKLRQGEAAAIVQARTKRRDGERKIIRGAVADRIRNVDELRRLLYSLLKNGPRDRSAVVEAIAIAGFSERQLSRSGQALELRYLRVGIRGARGGGKYMIALPAHAP